MLSSAVSGSDKPSKYAQRIFMSETYDEENDGAAENCFALFIETYHHRKYDFVLSSGLVLWIENIHSFVACVILRVGSLTCLCERYYYACMT
jgi:hypothetical protein